MSPRLFSPIASQERKHWICLFFPSRTNEKAKHELQGLWVEGREMVRCLRRVGRLLNEESHALHLFDVVKSQATNVSIWVCIFALVNFIKNLGGIIATKHRQLPQCPVPPVIVAWHPTVFSVHKSLLHWNKQTNKQTNPENRFFYFRSLKTDYTENAIQ